jgi:hypothetical protein
VKDDIRSMAFDVLTKKVKPEKLTSRQHCDLINELLKGGYVESFLILRWKNTNPISVLMHKKK